MEKSLSLADCFPSEVSHMYSMAESFSLKNSSIMTTIVLYTLLLNVFFELSVFSIKKMRVKVVSLCCYGRCFQSHFLHLFLRCPLPDSFKPFLAYCDSLSYRIKFLLIILILSYHASKLIIISENTIMICERPCL